MNLAQCEQVILRTHISAYLRGERASAIELKSGPGIGKSSLVFQACGHLAAMLGKPAGLVTEFLATIESMDVRGFMLPQKGEGGRPVTVFSTPPWLPSKLNTIVFMPDGRVLLPANGNPVPEAGILFLDEFGQASDEVKKAAAELLLHGSVGNDSLPVGWRVIAASNRLSDRAGVLRSLTFIANRRLELLVDAHLPTWNDWVGTLDANTRPHYLTVSFANKQPDLVFRDSVPANAGEEPFCTPRTLVLMDKDLRALRSPEEIANDRLPMDGVAREVARGWIGEGESAQYFVHVRFADLLPDIKDIEKDPMHAKLPPQPDAQMVLSYFLGHNLTDNNVSQIMDYVGRLSIEFQTLAVRATIKLPDKKKILALNPKYTAWLLKNRSILEASHG